MKKTVSHTSILSALCASVAVVAGVSIAARPDNSAYPLTVQDSDTCGALVAKLFESGATYLQPTPGAPVAMKTDYAYTATKNTVSVLYVANLVPVPVGTVRCDQSTKKQLSGWSWPAPISPVSGSISAKK